MTAKKTGTEGVVLPAVWDTCSLVPSFYNDCSQLLWLTALPKDLSWTVVLQSPTWTVVLQSPTWTKVLLSPTWTKVLLNPTWTKVLPVLHFLWLTRLWKQSSEKPWNNPVHCRLTSSTKDKHGSAHATWQSCESTLCHVGCLPSLWPVVWTRWLVGVSGFCFVWFAWRSLLCTTYCRPHLCCMLSSLGFTALLGLGVSFCGRCTVHCRSGYQLMTTGGSCSAVCLASHWLLLPGKPLLLPPPPPPPPAAVCLSVCLCGVSFVVV